MLCMPSIRPISDLRNNANEISDFCRQTREPVFITRNGTGDMVVMNLEEYERQMATIDLYGKLAIAEQQNSLRALPEVPGGYYTWRNVNNAFYAVTTGGVSSLNGQNSLTLTAAWAQGGGSYGAVLGTIKNIGSK